ncbi:WD repeat-containing protein 73 isoform X2 [Sceloporus undulatus]|uniref:WD repeat-containing protein 73 isoform X2 n=1 Tax=Sceloporus undulatus TaxID=8520 RepID=UPI001C4B4E46|nr:WD repeat-containing protein 73 isoform X2 [Sceloporus undulatus]
MERRDEEEEAEAEEEAWLLDSLRLLLVTSGPPDSGLQIWRMEPDGTDIIKLLGTIPTLPGGDEGWARIATTVSKPSRVLHGLRIGNLQVTDIESKQTLFMAASPSNEEVSTVDFLDEVTALACSMKGQLFLADTRQPPHLLGAAGDVPVPLASGGLRWCAGVRQNPLDCSAIDEPLIAQLSSGGHVVLRDLRNTTSPLAVVQCCVPTPGLHEVEFLSISFAPLLRGCLSLSGFDGTIHIYDTHNWDPSAQEAKPLFLHKGHVFSGASAAGHPPLVTTHAWHPSKPQTLLSAASDGSLHVWDWADPRGVS